MLFCRTVLRWSLSSCRAAKSLKLLHGPVELDHSLELSLIIELKFDIVCLLMPRACAACSCVIFASVLDFLILPPISTRLPPQHELHLDYALCEKRCLSKRFYKAEFLCQNTFTFLCLTQNAPIYLAIGSVISKTAPVSPLYARIVPLCRWMISRVRARPMPDLPLFPM